MGLKVWEVGNGDGDMASWEVGNKDGVEGMGSWEWGWG